MFLYSRHLSLHSSFSEHMRLFLHYISSFFLKHFSEVKPNPSPSSGTFTTTINILVFFALVSKDVNWRRVQNSVHHWQRCLKLPSFVTCVNFVILFVPASVLQAFRNRRLVIRQLSVGTDNRIYELQVILQSFDTTVLVNKFILFTVTSY